MQPQCVATLAGMDPSRDPSDRGLTVWPTQTRSGSCTFLVTGRDRRPAQALSATPSLLFALASDVGDPAAIRAVGHTSAATARTNDRACGGGRREFRSPWNGHVVTSCSDVDRYRRTPTPRRAFWSRLPVLPPHDRSGKRQHRRRYGNALVNTHWDRVGGCLRVACLAAAVVKSTSDLTPGSHNAAWAVCTRYVKRQATMRLRDERLHLCRQPTPRRRPQEAGSRPERRRARRGGTRTDVPLGSRLRRALVGARATAPPARDHLIGVAATLATRH